MAKKQQKIVVIGAGPVGCLAAIYAAQRNHDVEIYDLRGDPRHASTIPLNFSRSINLALSERGITAIRQAKCGDLLDRVLRDTTPMYGRMIHGEKNGILNEESQAYDTHGRFLHAADRTDLNNHLLNELGKSANVKLFFNHKLTGADFARNLAWLAQRNQTSGNYDRDEGGKEIEVHFDLLIGADGAHSATRFHLMKFCRMSYQQEYIDTLWCEFHVSSQPSEEGPAFKISPSHLHIWPGRDHMFIAIPSVDKTFTSTLFMPAAKFSELKLGTSRTLVNFFQQSLPGVVPQLISESDLWSQFCNNPHLPLVSIKCSPYHYSSSAVVIGDAAHAMVPFYGQGMNAGLEDVRLLFEFLDHPSDYVAANGDINPAQARALERYTKYRTPDAYAINDLALQNYKEMRSDVVSRTYKLRKWVEEWVSLQFPRLGWATQYSRVSFGNWRYSEVVQAAERQRMILQGMLAGATVGLAAGLGLLLLRNRQMRILA